MVRLFNEKFPFSHQLDSMDCGPACLQMIATYYGLNKKLLDVRELCYASKNGVTLQGICAAAETIGFRCKAINTTFDHWLRHMIFPCIVFWRQKHFIVVYKLRIKKSKRGNYRGYVIVGDPAYGIVKYSVEEFVEGWIYEQSDEKKGITLMLKPSKTFNQEKNELVNNRKFSLIYFWNYIRLYSRSIMSVLVGMLFILIIQMIFPFLTQSLVDVGVGENNLNFIFLVLGAQLLLSLSILFIEIFQSWILLHVISRVNIALIADFITKMLKLPIVFFDSKNTGDIMQRIEDHQRIEDFFTTTSVNTFFSFFSFIVFAVILGIYNVYMLSFFLFGHVIYVIWTMLFFKYRRVLDFKRFDKSAKNQSNMIQLIEGAEEIKLNNCEYKMRSAWEKIQEELLAINVQGMKIEQIQNIGAFFITNVVNTVLLAYAAWLVVKGNITLGMMMSLTYIIGQLKGPIQNFMSFTYAYQDARISLERLSEVHLQKDEDEINQTKISEFSLDQDIKIENLEFSYYGPSTSLIFDRLNLTIEHNKVTAIVGESGSGKTTLLKLLLGYYQPQKGRISVGNIDLKDINSYFWRNKCSAVMQDGFIFSASIMENIGIKDEVIDHNKLEYALKLSNSQSFISNLPAGLLTEIGQDGNGLSQGQKQRILIARAIYRNPAFLFFDEATNALDANNEKEIMQNMMYFFKGRTVVVIAHRLSTVKNADNIIVLKQGQIIEQGKHDQLIKLKSYYYNLVHDQLELAK